MAPTIDEVLERQRVAGNSLVDVDDSVFPVSDVLRFYDREGNRIPMRLFLILFEDREYQTVAFDRVSEGISVSTAWMGIDHTFGRAPAPLVFETMVFADHSGTEAYRWPTEAIALERHQALVEELRSHIP